MTKVYQTKFVESNKYNHGNCYAACIASLLDEKLDDIPNLETLFDLKDKQNLWVTVLHAWLEETRGVYISTADEFRCFHSMADSFMPYEEIDTNKEILKDKFYLISGKSPRGNFDHICIYQNGKLYHDPHPSNEGLEVESTFIKIESI